MNSNKMGGQQAVSDGLSAFRKYLGSNHNVVAAPIGLPTQTSGLLVSIKSPGQQELVVNSTIENDGAVMIYGSARPGPGQRWPNLVYTSNTVTGEDICELLVAEFENCLEKGFLQK